MKPATNSAVKGLEVLVWALLAFAAASSMRLLRPAPLSIDSYQYLSVAENLGHGRGLTTSLVHFDTERSHGRIPALLTTFPPGYPVVIASAGFRADLEDRARVVSSVCYAGTAALLAWALILTGVTAFVRQVVLLLFATNAPALSFATSVLTEPLYMLLSTGAVVGLIWAEKEALPEHIVITLAVIACSLVGLAYWVRYAGLFMIVAVAGYTWLQLILQRNRLRGILLLIAMIPIGSAGALMLRNLAAVGVWKGGNDMLVHHPLKSVMADYFRSQVHLILGRHAVTFGIWEGLLLLGGIGVAIVLTAAIRKAGAPDTRWLWRDGWRKLDAAALLAGFCVLVYSTGMIYAGLYTMISFGVRMFLPILPLYLLLLGMGIMWVTSRWPASARGAWLKAWLLLVTVGYAGVNARDLDEPLAPAQHEVLAAAYSKPAADGRSLLQWVESNIPEDATIMAADGQATGYLLRRPTLSMVDSQFSRVRWECDEVKKEMKRFDARYVILYKPTSKAGTELLAAGSQFVAASVTRQPPCGFVIAAENSDVRILTIGGKE